MLINKLKMLPINNDYIRLVKIKMFGKSHKIGANSKLPTHVINTIKLCLSWFLTGIPANAEIQEYGQRGYLWFLVSAGMTLNG
jgi:hypothetical protein